MDNIRIKLEPVSVLAGRYIAIDSTGVLIHAALTEDSEPLVLGAFKREPGEALCNRKWLTNDTSVQCVDGTAITCPRCLSKAARIERARLTAEAIRTGQGRPARTTHRIRGK